MVTDTSATFKVSLPDDLSIRLERVFDAPRELVYQVITTAKHVRNWYGCGMGEMTVCDIDLRVGGTYRFVLRMPDGSEHGFRGTYLAIERPVRLVHEEVYEGFPDAVSTVTVELAEVDGQTQLTSTVQHTCREHRDGHFQSGMEHGARASYDALARLLAELG